MGESRIARVSRKSRGSGEFEDQGQSTASRNGEDGDGGRLAEGRARHRKVVAMVLLAERGDISRLDSPKQLIAYLGLRFCALCSRAPGLSRCY